MVSMVGRSIDVGSKLHSPSLLPLYSSNTSTSLWALAHIVIVIIKTEWADRTNRTDGANWALASSQDE